MRGVYTASIKITALAASRTLLYVTAPATKAVEVLSAEVTNATIESNEQLECTWQRVTTLGTPTATTLVCAKHEDDMTAGSTVKGNVTASEPTYTADTELFRKGFPSVSGYEIGGIPEERFSILPSATAGLRMLSTPTAFDCIARVTFREIG
jgi:hypothetical protein